jgi:hypothetical protein
MSIGFREDDLKRKFDAELTQLKEAKKIAGATDAEIAIDIKNEIDVVIAALLAVIEANNHQIQQDLISRGVKL